MKPRVLVIRGGAIGDFILTLPAIKLLRDSIAGCHLEVLGYPGIIDLAVAAGLADASRSLEHRSMALLFVPNAKIDEALAEWLKSFNLVVSYLYDPDGHLAGNMQRIGMKTFLAMPSRVIDGQGHAAMQLAKPLESLAMYLEDPAPHIRMPQAWAPSDTIAIHPGSGSLKKNWPVEHWCRAGHELHALRPQARLALITGEAELERGITAQVLKAWKSLPVDHWDSLPLTELAARLPGCSVFLGHDSGIGHLAAACGLPCLLFFGPSDPATWAPQNTDVTVYQAVTKDLQEVSFDEGWGAIKAFIQGSTGIRFAASQLAG
ncbi:MAG: hypothetical protein JWO08_2544 [Verrucomicrobiaceae bacterium]|nr:hypothetical protein [Verrucomicrobiaceae bacterium]